MAEEGKTSHDRALGMGIIGAVLFGVFLIMWNLYGDAIKSAFRFFRWSEIWLLSFILPGDYTVETNGFRVSYEEGVKMIPEIPKENLNTEIMNAISLLAMHPLQWPAMVIIGLIGIWAYRSGPGTQYRRKMGLDDLIAAQAQTFPVITPFVRFNPGTMPHRPPGSPVPATLPSFSEALGPEEWLAYNQIPVPDGKIDRRAAYIAFARQLGPRWKGPVKLAPYKQIFLAACCLRTSRKRRESDDMMGRIALCWSHDKGLQLEKDKTLLRDARAILRNKDLAGKTLSKCNEHAFQTTALLRALNTAREEGGVMAPAQFVWLRGHDRLLWYPLNNLGRQAFHMEALGAMSHYKLEKRTMRPIPKPKVDDAVTSITDYMSSDRARPIPQLDYSGSKKRGIKKAAGK
ncbi:MAG: type IV secretion system protein [Alphaproteobacteria bacterium]|nr:type IV secretion system protein [Alphaproteobacteria bacterium]